VEDASVVIASLVIDVGTLGIAGFGVWRGQSLWSKRIDQKHELETSRLSMDRMERSIRLEMDQVKNLADIEVKKLELEQMKELPALGAGESSNLSDLPFVCGCDKSLSFHLHATKRGEMGVERVLTLSLGAIEAIKDGQFGNLCCCSRNPTAADVHAYGGGTQEPEVSLNRGGYTVLR
jgi:hypothetical protein